MSQCGDETSQDKTGQDRTRQDETGRDRTRQHKTSQDKPRQVELRQVKTGQVEARQNIREKTRQGKNIKKPRAKVQQWLEHVIVSNNKIWSIWSGGYGQKEETKRNMRDKKIRGYQITTLKEYHLVGPTLVLGACSQTAVGVIFWSWGCGLSAHMVLKVVEELVGLAGVCFELSEAQITCPTVEELACLAGVGAELGKTQSASFVCCAVLTLSNTQLLLITVHLNLLGHWAVRAQLQARGNNLVSVLSTNERRIAVFPAFKNSIRHTETIDK